MLKILIRIYRLKHNHIICIAVLFRRIPKLHSQLIIAHLRHRLHVILPINIIQSRRMRENQVHLRVGRPPLLFQIDG